MAATNSTARRPCVTKTRPIIDYLLPRSRAAAGLPPCRPNARPCLYAPQLEKTLFFSISRRADPQYERSEEHTSELKSLMRISYAVFCLKKKNHTTTPPCTYPT